jgi:hypothetical protein
LSHCRKKGEPFVPRDEEISKMADEI